MFVRGGDTGNEDVLNQHIATVYGGLQRLGNLTITACGPRTPNDAAPPEPRVISTTGAKLKHSSSNPNQGQWLAETVSSVSQSAQRPILVVEIGTCVGISGLYILSSLSKAGGGKLVTFEGSPELAKIATANFQELIDKFNLTNVDFEIVVGPLEDTFSERVNSIDGEVHLAFIDGNHLEEPTLSYHRQLRPKLWDRGVIVHDDISWGPGMCRAWQTIIEMESVNEIEELLLGGRPSRGVIRLGQTGEGRIIRTHVDGQVGRTARRVRNALATSRSR